MSDPETLTIDVNGFPTRIWRKGSGPKLGYLAGFGMTIGTVFGRLAGEEAARNVRN